MLILNGDGTITGNPDITLTESVSIAGTVTYEDVTSIDAVGVVTARSGIRIPTGSLGIGTESPAGPFQLGDSNSSNVIIAQNLGVDINDGAINLYQATSNVNATPFIISTDVGGVETEKLRFTAGGLLGIGTQSPSFTAGTGVHIAGGNAALKLQNTNNGDWAYVEYADESNTTRYIQGYRDASGLYAIRPGATLNATPGIAINPDGYVSGMASVSQGDGVNGRGKIVGYQQGTWTPIWAESGNNSNQATNYGTRVAYWWRTGNQVTVFANINLGSSAGISPNNALTLLNFPYATQNVAGYYGCSSSVHANGWTDNTMVFVNMLMPANGTRADIYYSTSSQSGNYSGMDYSKMGTGSMIFNLTYLTDDTTWTPTNGSLSA